MHLKKYKNFFYREGIDDKYVIDESLSNKGYYKNISKNIHNNFIVIDIGANIGAFTILAAKIAEKVFSFEPEKENFKLLKKNIKLNRIKNVCLFNYAVFGNEKEKELFIKDNESGRCSFYLNSDKTQKVKVISLKKIFEENSISFCNFLKIDTEGSEYEILKNLPPSYFKKIGIIALEFHDYIKNNELKNIIDLLTKNNFNVEKIENNSHICSGIIIAKKSRINKLSLFFSNYSKYANSKIHQDEISSKKISDFKKIWKYLDKFLGQGGIILKRIQKK